MRCLLIPAGSASLCDVDDCCRIIPESGDSAAELESVPITPDVQEELGAILYNRRGLRFHVFGPGQEDYVVWHEDVITLQFSESQVFLFETRYSWRILGPSLGKANSWAM